MMIVDDRLFLDVLAGRLADPGGEPTATTWGFHHRLVRALTDETGVGSLSRVATPALRRVASSPPAHRLTVLDPRLGTGSAAQFAVRHGLNLLAAELLAAATRTGATVVLSATNVGRSWPEVFAAENVDVQVRT